LQEELSDLAVSKRSEIDDAKSKRARTTYLFVELNEGGLEQFVQLGALVIGILYVTETLAHVVLLGQENLLDLTGQSVEWHLHVLRVPDFL
jgi:hypothetical protein